MTELEKLEYELNLAYGAMNVVTAFKKQWRLFDTVEKYDKAIGALSVATEIEIKTLTKKIEKIKTNEI